MNEVGNLLYQFGKVHGWAPRVIADVRQDVLQQVPSVRQTRVRERSAGRHYRWLEREFVLQQDLEVKLLYLLFHLLGDRLVCCVGHRRLVNLQLQERVRPKE